MRILMAVPNYPFPVVGGLERQAHELAKALIKRGHIIYAISGRFHSTQSDVEWIDGVLVHRLKWFEFKPARFLLFSINLAYILVKLRRNIDLVHLHNISWFGAFITLFAKVLGIPVLTKLPNVGDFGIPGIKKQPFGNLRIALLKLSDAIVAMTSESLTEATTVDYPMSQILKVTNGIEVDSPDRADLDPGISDTATVVFVGRFSEEKRLIDLIYAWASVQSRIQCTATLRLIGDGPQIAYIRSLTKILGLMDSVEFYGYSANVSTELAQANIFVLPSAAEGNSNAILEAMRAGLPIVASRVGGSSIQVGNEGQDFLFEPGDCETLADHLVTLIEDQALCKRLGATMHKRIVEKFAITRVATVYEDAYRLLIAGDCQQVGRLNSTLFEQD